jgi:DNA-directed RNA polymerase specialized sigma24 family protein
MVSATDDRAKQLAQFEGLIITTSRMWAAQVRLEEEDLAQELRVKVWYALPKWDPTRSALSLERYIFGVVTNRIFDFKRSAARERKRRDKNGLKFMHIEDLGGAAAYRDDWGGDIPNGQTRLDAHHCVGHDAVYGRVDEGKFVLPSTLTEIEAHVLVLLMFEWSKPEIALRLSLSKFEIARIVERLKEKLADWNPAQEADSSQVVAFAEQGVAVAA